jgi:hypothetical protein
MSPQPYSLKQWPVHRLFNIAHFFGCGKYSCTMSNLEQTLSALSLTM